MRYPVIQKGFSIVVACDCLKSSWNRGLQNIKIWPNIKPKLRGQLKMCCMYAEGIF